MKINEESDSIYLYCVDFASIYQGISNLLLQVSIKNSSFVILSSQKNLLFEDQIVYFSLIALCCLLIHANAM